MEKEKKDLSPYWIGGIFFAVFFAHFSLAVAWQKQFLIYFFNSTDCFTDAMSWAYQRIVPFGQGLSVLYKFQRMAVGGYWPPLVPIIGILNLLILPVQWFFLPNFFFLAMIMLGIYRSVLFLTGDKFHSMLAAVIFSCYGSVF